MLAALRIRDLAVIESLELEFEPGFTVLTGETGAGKSILVDALTLVLGGRASSDIIRTGAQSAEVEALVNLNDAPSARELLVSAGLLEDDSEPGEKGGPGEGEIVIRRLISRTGRNRVWINGRLESTGRLFELGRYLVDIYGQHEYQTLLRAERHLRLLDSFGGLSPKLEAYQAAYEQWREAVFERDALDLDEAKKREREDLLRYRVQEIEAAVLTPGEDERLLAEQELLRHAETLKSTSRLGVEQLYEADDSVLGRLEELCQGLREAAAHDPSFSGPAAQVEQAAAVLEEVAHDLRRFGDRIEADPDRLQWVMERLEELKRLKRKYGDTLEDVLNTLAEARGELARLEHQQERLKELAAEVESRWETAREMAHKLRKARARAGKALAGKVQQELASLGMEKTRFEVRLEPRGRGEDELGPHGADQAAFYISPNPGQDLKLLIKIASGGELSRIMLALRVLLLGEGEVSTMVFDEVDEGVGGAVAEAVGRRMRRLSRSQQVLCVTHLPQIAALAHQHLRVLKHQEKQRTWTEVKTLGHEQKIEELGRMMAGSDITDTARAHAQAMLDKAAQDEGKVPKKSGQAKKRRSG